MNIPGVFNTGCLILIAAAMLPVSGVSEDAVVQPVLEKPLPDPHVFSFEGWWYITGTARRMYAGRELAPSAMREVPLFFDMSPWPQNTQIWGFTPWRHEDGSWHAYLTLHLGHFHTVVAHFLPEKGQRWLPGAPLMKWKFDRLLAGNPDKEDYWCYESKMVRDEDGSLYLIYNDGKTNHGNVHIHAQRMLSPATPDPDFEARPILSPEGYRSEDRNPGYKQINEGASIRKVGGMYVLLYSVGDFMLKNYKLGMAFSKSLIPPPGKTYEKVLIPDPENLWGNENRKEEILYLLQGEKKEWPNYIGDIIRGPGLGNIVREKDKWTLVFHGYRASDEKPGPDQRRVWRLPLEIDIDPARPRREWIQPVLGELLQ